MTLDPLYQRHRLPARGRSTSPFHNLGLAIILLTLVVMLVQFPLIAKQARSMIQMQRVQPEIKKIQQKYKDDKAKQNEELLKFYQENKINPLAGCLPLLVTIPIGIAVFRTFSRDSRPTFRRRGTFGDAVHRHLRDTIATRRPRRAARAIAQHTPEAMRFLGMSLNLVGARGARLPDGSALLHPRRAGRAHRLVPGAPDPGPPDSRAATRRPTRRCR